ncbi:MAG: GNAT family N-acetyltransferase [Solirubrobacteraceae bacterium]
MQRPADDDLLEAVFACTRELELSALPDLPGLREQFLGQQYAAHQADRAVRWPGADHHAIVVDGEDVGALLVDRTAEPWHLVDIAVLPAAGGGGGGRAARAARLEVARGGGPGVELSVLPWNPAAALYTRLGFEAVGGDETATLMRWSPGGPQPKVIE